VLTCLIQFKQLAIHISPRLLLDVPGVMPNDDDRTHATAAGQGYGADLGADSVMLVGVGLDSLSRGHCYRLSVMRRRKGPLREQARSHS
jgi:hypothetical protein